MHTAGRPCVFARMHADAQRLRPGMGLAEQLVLLIVFTAPAWSAPTTGSTILLLAEGAGAAAYATALVASVQHACHRHRRCEVKTLAPEASVQQFVVHRGAGAPPAHVEVVTAPQDAFWPSADKHGPLADVVLPCLQTTADAFLGACVNDTRLPHSLLGFSKPPYHCVGRACTILEVEGGYTDLDDTSIARFAKAGVQPRTLAKLLVWRRLWLSTRQVELNNVVFASRDDDIVTLARVLFEMAGVGEQLFRESPKRGRVGDGRRGWPLARGEAVTNDQRDFREQAARLAGIGWTWGVERAWPAQADLQRVAVNQTLILTQANCAFLDMLANWVSSLLLSGLNNFYIFAEDEITYEFIASEFGSKHVVLMRDDTATTNETITGDLVFKTRGFNRLMERRIWYMHKVLTLGYNVLWMDIDTVVLQNPFSYIPSEAQVMLQQDGSPTIFCGCLMYFTPTGLGMELVARWQRAYDKLKIQTGGDATSTNQKHFNAANRDIIASRMGGDVRVFPPEQFPSGRQRFSKARLSMNAKVPAQEAWSHANWMFGHASKRNALRKVGFWFVPPERSFPGCTRR